MLSYLHFEKGVYGNKAVIKGQWQPYFQETLQNCNIVELELNRSRGWTGNIDFLKELDFLRCIRIVDDQLKSVNVLEKLPGLERLGLFTKYKCEFDFTALPNLTHVSINWQPSFNSVFAMTSLTQLNMKGFNKKSSKHFAALTNLEKLTLTHCGINNLIGLSKLDSLKCLCLDNLSGLHSLKGIEGLTSLRILEVLNCKKIESIREIFSILSLEKLLLNDLGSIDSLIGIENLFNLRVLQFNESTNIVDGNLLPLQKGSIESCSFKNRSHYFTKG